MNNELAAIIFTFVFLLSAIGFYKMGKVWLQVFLTSCYMITLCVTTKFFDLFGFPTSVGAVTYAGIFFATDMLTERYGKKAGYQTVRMGFAVTLLFVCVTQFTTRMFDALPFALESAEAMDTIFAGSLRVAVAGFSVYLIAQHFDVWLYHKIDTWLDGKHLWLRNNGSTLTSQLIDSALFFTLAFYGTMPNDQFIKVLLTGFGIKAIIALLDTPFMYMAKRITPLDLKDAERVA